MRALRQWIILSVVVNVGTDRVGCCQMAVSDTATAAVDVLIPVYHL